jgi:hypothetical protein
MRYGRKDVESAEQCAPDGRLPCKPFRAAASPQAALGATRQAEI